PHPRPDRRTGLGSVGGRGTWRRALHRFRGPARAGAGTAVFALHRDRLAPGAGLLGPWLRERGRTRGAGDRIRATGAGRDRVLHLVAEPALAGRDAAPRHAAGRAYLRASGRTARQPAARACAVSAAPARLGDEHMTGRGFTFMAGESGEWQIERIM